MADDLDPAAVERAASEYVHRRHNPLHDVGIGIVQGSHYRAGFVAGAVWQAEKARAALAAARDGERARTCTFCEQGRNDLLVVCSHCLAITAAPTVTAEQVHAAWDLTGGRIVPLSWARQFLRNLGIEVREP